MTINQDLANILANRINREELISIINSSPEQFHAAIRIALSNKEPIAWRATWLLGHCTNRNDTRIVPHITTFIKAIRNKKDGHQREILKILERMNVTDDQEGLLFNECMTIWTSIGKSPSVRITAFRILIGVARKYPDLFHEIELISRDNYTETLSPGIRHSFERIIKENYKL